MTVAQILRVRIQHGPGDSRNVASAYVLDAWVDVEAATAQRVQCLLRSQNKSVVPAVLRARVDTSLQVLNEALQDIKAWQR